MTALPPPPERPARVLAIGAHPDDVEFAAGATVARLRAGGAEVTLAVCTDGARGGGAGVTDLPARRRAEAERAAAALGCRQLLFLGFRDGELTAEEDLRRKLVREIRRARPELVLAHDPTTLWLRVGDVDRLGHSDHRAAGTGVLDAIYPRAGLAAFYPDQVAAGLQPWFVREIWLFDTAEPDHFVPIAEHAEAKRLALEAHESQDPGMLLRDAEARAALWSQRAGVPSEAFRRLRAW
ncbi:MAG TPA: PIG-L deacetylase family protein [Myxococcota bacterium]|nr:PIG-L deacetylase family protein [Myxococcota bacterium]